MRALLSAAILATVIAPAAQAGHFNIYDDFTNITANGQTYDSGNVPLVSVNGGTPTGDLYTNSVTQASSQVLTFETFGNGAGQTDHTYFIAHNNKIVVEVALTTDGTNVYGTYTDLLAAGGALADVPGTLGATQSVIDMTYILTAIPGYYLANSYDANFDIFGSYGFGANVDVTLPADPVVTATTTDTPEPASLALFGVAAIGLAAARRRRAR